MSRWIIGLLSLMVVVSTTPVEAAVSNFVTGNETDGTYVTRAERRAIKEAEAEVSGEPGFWEKEWERSRLNKFDDVDYKALPIVNPIGKLSRFFKEQDRRYKERQGYSTAEQI